MSLATDGLPMLVFWTAATLLSPPSSSVFYDDYAVWIDMLAINQHLNTNFSKQQNKEDVSMVEDALQLCNDGSLAVFDLLQVNPLDRAWSIHEYSWCVFYHGREALQFVGPTEA